MQEEYRPVIEHAIDLCISRFGDRLRTIVLSGSVAYGEALAGASDVDWFAFLTDEPNEDDLRWREDTKAVLENECPIITEFGLGLYSIDRLRNEESWRFIIKHNSIRLYGADIIAEFESEGITTPVIKGTLKSHIPWIEKMWKSACEGNIPEMLFKTPDDPFLAARKIARYFVFVEGAYLMMLNDSFVSFRQNDVILGLRSQHPQWEKVYMLADRVATNPAEAQVTPELLISELRSFMDWMIGYIKAA